MFETSCQAPLNYDFVKTNKYINNSFKQDVQMTALQNTPNQINFFS